MSRIDPTHRIVSLFCDCIIGSYFDRIIIFVDMVVNRLCINGKGTIIYYSPSINELTLEDTCKLTGNSDET